MLIQAFRRKESTVVELFGGLIKFDPNEAGHVVADVDDERSVDRLLAIDEAYREYLVEPDGAADAERIAAAQKEEAARLQAEADEAAARDEAKRLADEQAAVQAQRVADAEATRRAEQEAAEAAMKKDLTETADPLVLTNDAGETLDIGKLTAKQVRAKAAEQDPPIELPAGNSTPVGELRLLLAKGLKGE